MTVQLSASPSNKKISELYRRIKDGSLILQPEFQRRFVWSADHKESFIETILSGLPFPEIYIAQSGIDIEKIETQEVIVDGQQRLGTLVQYIDNSDTHLFGKKVPKFADLVKKDKTDFLNYNVVVRDLGDVTPDVIKEIFRRINLTKYGLNDVEIHNAVYDGKFISTAKEILENVDLTIFPVFSDSDIARMADLHFILSVMATLEEGGYFSRDSDIEKHIIANNDSYEDSEEIKALIIQTFNNIEQLNLDVGSVWYRKSNFFTLFIELTWHREEIDLAVIKPKLNDFENNVLENRHSEKNANDFSLYYSYMYTGTNSRMARVTRGKLFTKYIL